MSDSQEYIQSGILEEFVLGLTSEEENLQVARMAFAYPEIRKEIDEISAALAGYAATKAPPLDPTIKPLLMASIDYMERIRSGEPLSHPPVLNEQSKPSDFSEWLQKPEMAFPGDFEEVYASLMAYGPESMTAVVWLATGAPPEVHHAQHEKFLILEGNCDIIIDDEVISLVPGDYLGIPLHKSHAVRVTSSVPCKIILQRLAA